MNHLNYLSLRFCLLLLLFVAQCLEHVKCLAAASQPQNPSDNINKNDNNNNNDNNIIIKSVVSTNGRNQQLHYSFAKTVSDDYFLAQSNKKMKRLFNFNTMTNKVSSIFQSTFLPNGFSIQATNDNNNNINKGTGYLRYCIWSMIQDLSTQLRSVLATQCILQGVGVGQQDATTLSALLNFLIRDGCGMLATLLFTFVSSSKFRTDIKRWRLFADIMVDLGITLEVLAIVTPRVYFLPMISIGTMCKAICGVAAGSCNGAINLYWAKVIPETDISDINAKFGAQNTMTGAVGLIVAAYFAKSVSNFKRLGVVLYTLLTILHIFANVRCMRLISFSTCNQSRLKILFQQFINQEPLSTPQVMAKQEPLTFLPRRQKNNGIKIYNGDSFNHFCKVVSNSKSTTDIKHLLLQEEQTKQDGYIITTGIRPKSKRPCVSVCLLEHCTPLQQYKAYTHAMLLQHYYYSNTNLKQQQQDQQIIIDTLSKVEQIVQEQFPDFWINFLDLCQKSGWELQNHCELSSLGYKIQISK